jgi:hypothetical protein
MPIGTSTRRCLGEVEASVHRQCCQADAVRVTFEAATCIAAPPAVVFDLSLTIDSQPAARADNRSVAGQFLLLLAAARTPS